MASAVEALIEVRAIKMGKLDRSRFHLYGIGVEVDEPILICVATSEASQEAITMAEAILLRLTRKPPRQHA